MEICKAMGKELSYIQQQKKELSYKATNLLRNSEYRMTYMHRFENYTSEDLTM